MQESHNNSTAADSNVGQRALKAKFFGKTVAEVIHEAGFQRPYLWQGYASKVAALVVALLCGLVLGTKISSLRNDWPEVFATVAGLVVIAMGYVQWRAGRHEASFDKYYERLELANRRMERMAGGWEDSFTMLVFAELDNLEYMSEKYKLGHVKPELVCRTLRHFYARCVDPYQGKKFRESAFYWINMAAYEDTTKKIVEKVCKEASMEADTFMDNNQVDIGDGVNLITVLDNGQLQSISTRASR